MQILGGGTTLDSHRELSIVIVKLYKACHHDRPFLIQRFKREIPINIILQKNTRGYNHARQRLSQNQR